jgi:hypothetical protein
MNLCFLRVIRHTAHEFGILQCSTNPHLSWRCPDFAFQRSRNTHTDPFFSNTVRTTNNQESATSLLGSDLRCDAVVLGFDRSLHEFSHSGASSLAFHNLPGIAFFRTLLFETYAHVGAGCDDIFLAGECIPRVQVGCVEIADVDLLLFRFSSYGVYDIRHELWVSDVRWTSAEIATVEYSLDLRVCTFSNDFFEEEE